MKKQKRLLLTGVFGPFGVDDEFGRKRNVMELHHNQVTRAQGLASLRMQHRSFGLYFLAENVNTPTMVLDFPSRERFIEVLKSEHFDAIGISFILPNLVKAKEMARLIRLYQPHAEIILGGHGTAFAEIEQHVDCDHVVRGEGIQWLRTYLGEDPHRPIKHPILPAADTRHAYGIPFPGVTGLMVPGVGCVNGCRFCATSHFFRKEYTPFFATGDQLFEQACAISDALGTNDIFVMDENFLKNRARVMRLLELMEQHNRPFTFNIFSSAEAIEAVGVDNIVRLGVTFVWIGAESKQEVYAKNKGRDVPALIAQLREHGISVLVSGILFLEHHDHETIQEDVDYIIELGGDFTQFMMLMPLPDTALFKQYQAKGLINWELPFEDWHGQEVLSYKHPNFEHEETTQILDDAFKQEYDRKSSSIVRVLATTLRGIRTLSKKRTDRWLEVRYQQMLARAHAHTAMFPTLRFFAHNDLELQRAEQIVRDHEDYVGSLSLAERARGYAALGLAMAYAAMVKVQGDMRQPSTFLTHYRWDGETEGGIETSIPEAKLPFLELIRQQILHKGA